MTPIGPITHLVIHHSASKPNTRFETIRRWHTAPKPKGRGWSAIGYHHVILGDGSIRVGRPLTERGAHAPPNKGRIGVCVVGDNTVDGHGWTAAQIEALEDYVAAVRVLYPGITVVGHSSTKATACPGLDIKDLGL